MSKRFISSAVLLSFTSNHFKKDHTEEHTSAWSNQTVKHYITSR
jgi:hypothetical protein